jgi:hypothetical protein
MLYSTPDRTAAVLAVMLLRSRKVLLHLRQPRSWLLLLVLVLLLLWRLPPLAAVPAPAAAVPPAAAVDALPPVRCCAWVAVAPASRSGSLGLLCNVMLLMLACQHPYHRHSCMLLLLVGLLLQE